MESSSVSSVGTLSPAERLRRSEAAGRALVSGWESSGKTMRAYAQSIGVRAQRLSYWRLRLRQRDGAQASGSVDFVEISRPVRSSGSSGVVIALPNGVRLYLERGFDASVLRSAVAALSDATAPSC